MVISQNHSWRTSKVRMEQLSDKNSPLNKFIQQTRQEIERLNDPIFRVIELSKTLGDAFSESFRGIINGSMTAQEALANLFQRTANHFIDMAAQMIAAQIRMQAVNLFMSFFNPFGGGNAINTNSLNHFNVFRHWSLLPDLPCPGGLVLTEGLLERVSLTWLASVALSCLSLVALEHRSKQRNGRV